MTATAPAPDDNVVTDERARMLALHAIHVQGGFSDPERERLRAEADIARGGSIDWNRMQGELDAALAAQAPAKVETSATKADPTPSKGVTRRDITAVQGDVIAGEMLRDQIKQLTATLKEHEDNIKDALGEATVGTDGSGKVLVRWPVRNRTDLDKSQVKDKLGEVEYAACEKVSTYRTLLYGA